MSYVRKIDKSPAANLQRFWSRVNKTGDCWLWMAGAAQGYGEFYWLERGKHNRFYRAHRFSYELHFGPIPPGLFVLHNCDNRACVRPEHLRLGTNQDNMNDKVVRRRHPAHRGAWAPGRKLTNKHVSEIRRRYAAGAITQKALASLYGISLRTVSDVIRRASFINHIETTE
jgi:hypothetical protein